MTLKKYEVKWYGWRPDLPDHRDYKYKVTAPIELPRSTNLRPHCPPVLDQGQLGSCTANSIASCHQFVQMKEKLSVITPPSRLFIYYNERVIEGDPESDNGAEIRDGFKTIAKEGICPEPAWPYIISKFAIKPPTQCYVDALSHVALQYQRLDNTNLTQLKQCLAEGYPFVFGFSVYESFESEKVARTGTVYLPKSTEQLLGGHAVMAVGYNDFTHRFYVQNSWGTDWGQKGYFSIPYNYLTNPNLADDFWTLRLVK